MSRSRLRIPEPYRKFARTAKRLGWLISMAGNGHLRWTPPAGLPLYTAGTPGSGAGDDRAKLKRAGLTEERA